MSRMRSARHAAASSSLARALWLAAACLSLGLGLLGIVVPGLPTTPFILLASFCASRSSSRLHAWLRQHRHFGPMIVDWEETGAVRRQAKWAASAMMALCSALMWLLGLSLKIWLVATLSMAAVATWLWLRPEPRASSRHAGDAGDAAGG